MTKFLRFFIRFFIITFIVLIALIAIYIAFWFAQLKKLDHYLPEKPTIQLNIPNLGVLATEWLNLEAADIVFATQSMGEIRQLVRDLRSTNITKNPLLQHLSSVPLVFAMTEQDFVLSFDLGWRSLLLQPINWFSGMISLPDLSLIQTQGFQYFRYQTGDTNLFVALRHNIVLITDRERRLQELLAKEQGDPVIPASESRAAIIFRQSSDSLKILVNTPALLRNLTQQNPDLATLLKNFSLTQESVLSFKLTNQNLNFRLATSVQGTSEPSQRVIQHRPTPTQQFGLIPSNVTTWTLLNVASLDDLLNLLLAQEPSLKETIQTARDTTKSLLGISMEELLFNWTTGEFGAYLLPQSDEPIILVKIANRSAFQAALGALEKSLFFSPSTQFVVDQIPINQLKLPSYLEFILQLFNISMQLPYYTIQENYLLLSNDSGNLVRSVNAVLEGKTIEKSPEVLPLMQDIDRNARLLLFYNAQVEPPFFMRDQSILSRVLRLYQQGIVSVSLNGEDLDVVIHASRLENQTLQLLPGYPRPLQGRLTSRLYVVTPIGTNQPFLAYVADANRLILDGLFSESLRSLDFPNAKYLVVENSALGTVRLWGFSRDGKVYAWNPNGTPLSGFPVDLQEGCLFEPVLLNEKLFVITDRRNKVLLISSSGTTESWQTALEDLVSHPPAMRDQRLAIYSSTFNGEILVFDARGNSLQNSPVTTEGLGVGSPLWMLRQGQLWLYLLTKDGQLQAWNNRLESAGVIARLNQGFHIPPLVLKSRGSTESLAILSDQGILSLISPEGEILREVQLNISTADARLSAFDLDVDGNTEILISGFGSQILVIDQQLRPFTTENILGYSEPSFYDINGDRKPDLITAGLDQNIYAWSFSKKE